MRLALTLGGFFAKLRDISLIFGPGKRGAQASLRAEHAFVGKRRNTAEAGAGKRRFARVS